MENTSNTGVVWWKNVDRAMKLLKLVGLEAK